jgi:hypothetical protein
MNQNNPVIKGLLSVLPFILIFIITYVFFAFFGAYILFFQEKSSLFILTKEFLSENLHQPGGFLIWLGKLLSSFFLFPAAGAFIIAAVLTLIAFFSSKIILHLTGKKGIVFSILIVSILFFLQTEYRFLFFNLAGLLLQLLLFLLTIRYLKGLNGWIPILILPLWYYLTGGFASIYSVMLTLFFVETGIKGNWIKLATLWCVNILTFYLLKEFIFFQTTETLLLYPWSDLSTGSQSKIFFIAAGIISLLPLLSKIRITVPAKIKMGQQVEILTISVFTILIISTVAILRFDKKNASYFRVEKLFCEGNYNEVISWNLKHPPTNKLTIFLTNVALCETGKLNDMLFNFPQSPDGSTLFLKWEMTGEILRRGGYFYYATGMINEAHRWAFENMVMKGLTPEGLKMLIRTEIINGNYKMASRYVNLLKHTLFYRKESVDFERFLFNDTAVNDDKELGTKRKIKLKTDFFTITDDPNINIERVFASDSLNRQVFEYKTAFAMLRKDYSAIADAFPQFARYGYSKFPVHIEEAAAALSVFNNGRLPDLGTLQLSSNTATRWEQFLTVFQKYGTNPQTAEPALRKQFGNTFWYYSFYK